MMNHSLCHGAQPIVSLPPRGNHFPGYGNLHVRYPKRVSMLLPSLKAVQTRAVHPFDRNGFGFVSKSKRSVFACNAALNAKCSQGQTQTVTRKTPTISQAPNHGKEKSPKLDDSGNGFPPRDDGGGGGGGGGGESFSAPVIGTSGCCCIIGSGSLHCDVVAMAKARRSILKL